MIKVSILGATGYTGSELIRLLILRDDIEFKYLTSNRFVGESVSAYYPHLTGLIEMEFTEYDPEVILSESDVVFICLPHGHAMTIAKDAQKYPVKLIDVSPDFRIKDKKLYEEYYQIEQTAPELLETAVYGLPEIHREQIKDADIIANPGCFVTSSLLGLLPMINSKLIETDSIIIDAKSGISGAGRSANVANLLSELQGNFKAYNVLKHRHIPEIEQELQLQTEDNVQVQFTPHLIPIERGIFSTIYADLTQEVTEEQIHKIYTEHYQGEPFIQVLPEGQLPELKAIRGTNLCHIQVQVDQRTQRLVILVVLDNLVKGAAGQAIQNMNLMFNLPETSGLKLVPLVP